MRNLLLAAVLSVTALTAQTLTLNEATVVNAAPKRLGLNWGPTNYYDSGNIYKNLLIPTNAGFEPWYKAQIQQCQSGTTTTCVAGNIYDEAPLNWWAGATFRVVSGASGIVGCSGTIASSTAAVWATNPTNAITYQFSTPCSQAIQLDDYIMIRKTLPIEIGWYGNANGAATWGVQSADNRPGTTGLQTLTADTTAAGSSVSFGTNLDSTNYINYTVFNGTFVMKFWAKQVSGSNTVTASINRGGGVSASQSFTPTTSWAQYTMTFTGTETGSSPANTITVGLSTGGQGVLLLDDVDLEKTSGLDATNTSAYKDEAVAAVRALNPQYLRYWDGQQGDPLSDWIKPGTGRGVPNAGEGCAGYVPATSGRGGYAGCGDVPGQPAESLTEFLQLCELLNVTPYIVVPITFESTDWQNLSDFLSGSTGTTYGALRATYGHPTPYSSTLPHIYLSLGNEVWNTGADGTNMTPYARVKEDRYGEFANANFGSMKAMPSFVSSWYSLVLNCQGDTGNAFFCQELHDVSLYDDAIEIAGYVPGGWGELSSVDTPQHEWQAESGQAWAESHNPSLGNMDIYETWLAGLARKPQLTVYEYGSNMLSFSGPVTQAQYTNHLNALMNGPIQVSAAMERNHYFNPVQAEWNMTEQGNRWGMFMDFGGQVSLRAGKQFTMRPTAIGMMIANNAIMGSEYSATLSGSPTYSSTGLNTLPAYSNVPSLFAYAYKSGTNRSVLLVNTDPVNSTTVTFAGNTPTGTWTINRMANTSGYNDINNETSPNNITLATSTTAVSSSYTVPAATVVSLAWSSSGGGAVVTNSAVMKGNLYLKGKAISR